MQRRVFKTTRGGGFQNPFSKVDLSKYTQPTNDLMEGLNEAISKSRFKGKARKVIFKDQPNLIYISFKQTKEKAIYEACKFFKDSFYPTFMGDRELYSEMEQARATRVQEFDKYGMEGKIPIPELMKVMKFTFPCSVCGKDNFNYEDYEIGRCFLVEGEGDLNPFTKGYVLCYDCYKKYIQTTA